MRINRRAAAVVLYGGWLLLFNPKQNQPTAPLASWERVDDFDTGYLCEQARHEAVLAAGKKDDDKEKPKTPADAETRYRCERRERVETKR